jgi:hypothetical protein
MGFIPEIRIKTIYHIAKNSQAKIHLVTLDNTRSDNNNTQFSFIMDTLKILKSAGNIQVECSCIKRGINPERSFVDYAARVNADVLMTNKRVSYSGLQTLFRNLAKPFLKMNYYGSKTSYQPTL